MNRDSTRRSPIWPYLAILTCLFVLSITAPRSWNRMRRENTLSYALSARKSLPATAYFNQDSSLDERDGGVESTRTVDRSGTHPLGPEPGPAMELAEAIRETIEIAHRSDPPAIETDRLALEQEFNAATESPAPDIDQAAGNDFPIERLPPVESTSDVASVAVADESAPAPDVSTPDDSSWPLPRLLVEQLSRLAEADRNAAWAYRAEQLIQQLCAPDSKAAASREEIIHELRKLVDRITLASQGDSKLETQAARARYTLGRWLDIWEPAIDLEKVSLAANAATMNKAAEQIRLSVADINSLARKKMDGNGWSDYLKLDNLRELTGAGQNDDERRHMARRVLDRMASTRLTRSQLKFIAKSEVAALQTQLRVWAAEPVTAAQLLQHLERYDHLGLPSDARLVANDFRALSWSAPREAEKVSSRLDAHYRNANVRLVLTGTILNRLVPQPEASVAAVNDRVLNVPIYGSSTTSTKVSVKLIPDPHRIRLALQAEGLVASDTVATSGPATFRSQGRSNFTVSKLVVVGPHGMSVWPAAAEADNNYNYLMSLETNFDGVPLVGSLVRNMARSKHEQSQGQARMEVEQKVAWRARTEFDAQVQPLLVNVAEKIAKRESETLDRLGLEIVPVEFSTTDDRVMARVRLATPQQLGAHTPRPRAPSDSWYSLQVHESALNNTIEQLQLNGRKFELPELFAWVAKKLDRPQMAKLDDLPEDVRLTFAKQDAVRVRCEGGQLEVILSFAELTQGRSHWRDFTVRTYYKPEPNKSNAQFVRDGTIHLEGRSLKGKVQPVLRAIFSKVLSVNRPLTMVGEKITGDPRIQDLKITQFVVEDGWIAVAYSPGRAPANVVRRPK